MKNLCFSLLCPLFFLCATHQAMGDNKYKQHTPQFKDYPAEPLYRGKNHPLVMDEFGKMFRTRLRYAIKHGKPTFAGHYIVTGWGCGTSGCNTGAIIDAKTGKAYGLPVATTVTLVDRATRETIKALPNRKAENVTQACISMLKKGGHQQHHL